MYASLKLPLLLLRRFSAVRLALEVRRPIRASLHRIGHSRHAVDGSPHPISWPLLGRLLDLWRFSSQAKNVVDVVGDAWLKGEAVSEGLFVKGQDLDGLIVWIKGQVSHVGVFWIPIAACVDMSVLFSVAAVKN
jgi:hypothetical protein